MPKRILGIKRDRKFSPNHIYNDALIIQMTARNLERMGYLVKLVSETGFIKDENTYDGYFSMGRNGKTLEKLSKLESENSKVINSPGGVYNSYREKIFDLLSRNNIPAPKSLLIENSGLESAIFESLPEGKLWLKRENHSLHREDVTPVYNHAELENTLKEFRKRGIKKSIIQEHKPGSEIKLYGVKGTGFFSWFYVNGGVHHAFDESLLVALADKAASISGLDVYGADAIISEDGEISFIDFNDWPSFAPFREQASKSIAELIDNHLSGRE